MEPFTNRIILTAHDRDGLDEVNYIFEFLAREGIDIKQAVRDACNEYCTTEKGIETLAHNCGCFNWGDFAMYVPNDICIKHGFIKNDTSDVFLSVDFNETLIDGNIIVET